MWFGGVAWSASWLGAVGHVPGTGNVGAAVLLAVASTGCYAASAVLQEREARRQDAGGAALLRRLVRRPWWWLAVAATVAGAVLRRRAGIRAAEPGAAVRSADAGPRATTGPRPGRAAGDRTRMARGRCRCCRAGRGAGGATPSGALVPPAPRAGSGRRRRGSRARGGPRGGGRLDTGPCCAGGARGRGRDMFRFRLRDGANRGDRSHLVPARRCAGRAGRGDRVGFRNSPTEPEGWEHRWPPKSWSTLWSPC